MSVGLQAKNKTVPVHLVGEVTRLDFFFQTRESSMAHSFVFIEDTIRVGIIISTTSSQMLIPKVTQSKGISGG